MTQKELIEALINEMVEYGEAFIGTYDVQGDKVCNLVKKINKEIGKKYAGMVISWNAETGYARMV